MERKPEEVFRLERDKQLEIFRESAACIFPGCCERAIGSHTFPKSVLKKISGGKLFYTTRFEKEDEILRRRESASAGVERLFCKYHDDVVFRRIERESENTDIELFLYLYAYRAFAHEYFFDVYSRGDGGWPDTCAEATHSVLLRGAVKERYQIDEFLSRVLFNKVNPRSEITSLKELFDSVFADGEFPELERFKQNFDLKYFALDVPPRLMMTGIQTFHFDFFPGSGRIPMVLLLVPSRDARNSYFAIISPKSEREAFCLLRGDFIRHFKEIVTPKSEGFIPMVLLCMLDASENIVLSDSLYQQWDKDGSLACFFEVWEQLTRGRLQPEQQSEIKSQALISIRKINLTAWLAG